MLEDVLSNPFQLLCVRALGCVEIPVLVLVRGDSFLDRLKQRARNTVHLGAHPVEKPEKVKPKALEDAFERFEKKQQNTDSTFDGAVKSVEKQKRRLEDAFEDAKRKAAENPEEKPRRPFDDLFD